MLQKDKDWYIEQLMERFPEWKQKLIDFRNNQDDVFKMSFYITHDHFPTWLLLMELVHFLEKTSKYKAKVLLNKLLYYGMTLVIKTLIPIIRKKGADVQLDESLLWSELQKQRARELLKDVDEASILYLILSKGGIKNDT